MGCKNSRDCRQEDVNPFDVSQQRSMSRTHRTPRSRTSTPHGSHRTSPRGEPGVASDDENEKRYEVTEVPLVFSRFESLPPGAIKRSVYSVYDGDTITLRGKDNAKVRLLAMDTPEVQDHEPYALEARDFVAKLILKKDIYLVFEGQEKDRYGRFLAYIYVKDKSVPPFKYINVNVAVIEAGLANYYHPQPTPLVLDNVFLAAQREARRKKLHLWEKVCEDLVVYHTAHGRAFHRKKCRSIEHVPLSSMIMKEALDNGHYACRDCHPNWASGKASSSQLCEEKGAAHAEVVPKPKIMDETTVEAEAVHPSTEKAEVAVEGETSVETADQENDGDAVVADGAG